MLVFSLSLGKAARVTCRLQFPNFQSSVISRTAFRRGQTSTRRHFGEDRQAPAGDRLMRTFIVNFGQTMTVRAPCVRGDKARIGDKARNFQLSVFSRTAFGEGRQAPASVN